MTEIKTIKACSIWRALDVLGDKPTLLILESYWLGSRRFSDFHKQTGLLKTVISDRLQKLLKAGCMQKIPYSDKPLRFEYRGTEKLLDLYPVALSMLNWENKWNDNHHKIAVRLTHETCGQATTPILQNDCCASVIDAREVEWKVGPGLSDVPLNYQRRRKTTLDVTNRNTALFDSIIDVIGDRWSSLIIRSVFTQINHFQDIQDETQMASNILSERLLDLVARNILKRLEVDKRRVQYRLTEKGRDIYPILMSLLVWGDRWYADEKGPPLVLTHRPCQKPLQMNIICSACGDKIHVSDMSFEVADGGTGRFATNPYRAARTA
ncbi:MAG: winged helix-turn-helix transcriptional regulator [Parvibaculales bacterium]